MPLLPSFPLWKHSEIDIVLDDDNGCHGLVNSYTNLDKISGHVWIKCHRDTPFQELAICFEGIAETYIEKVATTAPACGRTVGRHRFLRLLQPIDPESLPPRNVALAGIAYGIPFEFVVPDQLLDRQCAHQAESPQVHEAHLQVPPSFGDPLLATVGETLGDDVAPPMSKIQYRIRARLIKSRATGTKSSVVVEKSLRLRIVPAKEEDPPLDISDEDKEFELRSQKDVRKGFFGNKVGLITAEAQQPRGFRLPGLKNLTHGPTSAKTTVYLRFDPVAENAQPPALSSIVSKLRAETFFGSVPFREIASRRNLDTWDLQRGVYTYPIELSSRCISSVEWHKHDAGQVSTSDLSRRVSTGSNEMVLEPSSAYRPGMPFYTAQVLVPMSLPPDKVFTPTFHTCLISRTYLLELNISYHNLRTTASTSSIELKLPIQISAEGNPSATAIIGIAEAEAIAAREVDEDMAEGRYSPRVLTQSTPTPAYSERPRPVGALLVNRRRDQHRDSSTVGPSLVNPGPPAYSRDVWLRPRLRAGVFESGSLDTLAAPQASGVSVK